MAVSNYTFGRVVRRDTLGAAKVEAAQYDALTTGPTKEFLRELERATRYGGQTLTAICLAGDYAASDMPGVDISTQQDPLNLEEVA